MPNETTLARRPRLTHLLILDRRPLRLPNALTVSPYLGEDSLSPFVSAARENAGGIFVLVKTSNPGGGQFQDLNSDSKPLYRHVANFVEQIAAEDAGSQNGGSVNYGAVGVVGGAHLSRSAC